MKYLIVPIDRIEKLKEMDFPPNHKLNPILQYLSDGKEVYVLPYDLKENKIFEKAIADFEVCEVKEIETIEQKYYDSKDVEVLPTLTKDATVYVVDSKEVDPMTLTCKTILTEKIIDPIKIDPIITK